MVVSQWGVAFLAGLLTPLGAVCVLPMYPGYLAFLAGPGGRIATRAGRLLLGLVSTAGILASLFLFGLVVVFILAFPLSGAIAVIAPVAYVLLAVFGFLLVIDRFPEFSLPGLNLPAEKGPYLGALLFGLFFGVLALPCNAAPIAVLIALSTSTTDFLANMLNFIFFGIGMAMPVIALSLIPMEKGKAGTAFLVGNRRIVNLATGILMIAVALYYLVIVSGLF